MVSRCRPVSGGAHRLASHGAGESHKSCDGLQGGILRQELDVRLTIDEDRAPFVYPLQHATFSSSALLFLGHDNRTADASPDAVWAVRRTRTGDKPG
jgi:hypothetical protein